VRKWQEEQRKLRPRKEHRKESTSFNCEATKGSKEKENKQREDDPRRRRTQRRTLIL